MLRARDTCYAPKTHAPRQRHMLGLKTHAPDQEHMLVGYGHRATDTGHSLHAEKHRVRPPPSRKTQGPTPPRRKTQGPASTGSNSTGSAPETPAPPPKTHAPRQKHMLHAKDTCCAPKTHAARQRHMLRTRNTCSSATAPETHARRRKTHASGERHMLETHAPRQETQGLRTRGPTPRAPKHTGSGIRRVEEPRVLGQRHMAKDTGTGRRSPEETPGPRRQTSARGTASRRTPILRGSVMPRRTRAPEPARPAPPPPRPA